jgi:hypothetical protein
MWNSHALGQVDAQAVEKRGLGGVGLGCATIVVRILAALD